MNLYEEIEKRCVGVSRFLRLFSPKPLGELASDYERLFELCRLVPKMYGNPLYRDVVATVYPLLGVIPSEHNCEAIWRAYNGESCEIEGVTESVFDINIVSEAYDPSITLMEVDSFEKPNPYSVAVARDKSAKGVLDARERILLKIQEVRECAQRCILNSEKLVIDVIDTPLLVLCQVIEYLESCALLPHTVAVLHNCSEEESSCLQRLLASRKISVVFRPQSSDELQRSLLYMACELPVGIVGIETSYIEATEISKVVSRLIGEWSDCGLAFGEALVRVKEISINDLQRY